MDKKEWGNLYTELDKILSDFILTYPTYKNGSNKQKRDAAEKTIETIISRAERLINRKEVIVLVDYPDEIFAFRNFENDLKRLMYKIKTEIQ